MSHEKFRALQFWTLILACTPWPQARLAAIVFILSTLIGVLVDIRRDRGGDK